MALIVNAMQQRSTRLVLTFRSDFRTFVKKLLISHYELNYLNPLEISHKPVLESMALVNNLKHLICHQHIQQNMVLELTM